jgi:hypothetical protein
MGVSRSPASWLVVVALVACERAPREGGAPATIESAAIAPAARGARGAYAVSGQTPWNIPGRENPTVESDAGAPPPPQEPPWATPAAEPDGGGISL